MPGSVQRHTSAGITPTHTRGHIVMDDFRSLLQTPMDEIKRPPTWPAGTYHAIVRNHEFGTSKNKKTPYVRFHFAVMHPGEDVDVAGLEGIDISKRDWTKDFYLTGDALYRVKEFLVSVGVEVEGRGLGECIPEATNSMVLLPVIQRNSEDGKSIFNDIGDPVRGED
jgi:hypothetical protein